ncbi:9965_t:CDS:2 [Entrophospora sp. SA101]|nr:14719_t:CDS:2 [Entrophospora sp. SA101]CAJ0833069.1 9965_t:CDS:2 [Entrophospora sp. SA101]
MENPASNIYPASPSEQHQHHLNSSNNNKTYSQQYQRDEYHQFRLPPPSNFNFNYTPLPTPAAQTSSITDAIRPELLMSVMCENGKKSLELDGQLDEDMKSTFKFLHVSGTAKAKTFTLKLKIFDNLTNPTLNSSSPRNSTSIPPSAIFDSSPITIISKPSKKTAKARNLSSCILSGSQISLFNRINSQTVRTKYMGIEDGRLCARNTSWSSFIITVIILSNPVTGFTSDRLIIRKVEKSRILQNATGPVSQMQKIALQRIIRRPPSNNNNMHHRHHQYHHEYEYESLYLSAAEFTKEPFRSMNIINNGNVYSTGVNSRGCIVGGGGNDGVTMSTSTVEEIDDYLCWTIVGISKFQHSYYEQDS